MLILARKKNQTLRIGDDILITVIDIQGDQVRLGINAPRDVQILRQELYEAVKEANTQAAQTAQAVEVLKLFEQTKILDEKTSNTAEKP